MFTNITWPQFSIIIGIVTLVYYICILAFFYKKRLLFFFTNAGQQDSSNLYVPGNTNDIEAASTLSLSEELAPLLDDVRETLTQAYLKKFSIEELIFSLQIGMHKYEATLLFANKNIINQFIKNSAQNICSIHLDDERLNQLWIR